MNKVLLFFLTFLPVYLAGASIIRSPQPVDIGKISAGIYYEVFSTNSIFENLSLSLGYGIAEKMEVELFFYQNGIVFNLKPALKQIDPFIVSGILEIGFDFKLNFYYGLAIMMDLKLYDFLNIYLAAKGRYPANQYLDSTMRKESGFQFMPFIGLELFRNSILSLISEYGFSISWDNRLPSYFLSCGLRTRF